MDGSERAKFDNFDDAIIFAKAVQPKSINKVTIKSKEKK